MDPTAGAAADSTVNRWKKVGNPSSLRPSSFSNALRSDEGSDERQPSRLPGGSTQTSDRVSVTITNREPERWQPVGGWEKDRSQQMLVSRNDVQQASFATSPEPTNELRDESLAPSVPKRTRMTSPKLSSRRNTGVEPANYQEPVSPSLEIPNPSAELPKLPGEKSLLPPSNPPTPPSPTLDSLPKSLSEPQVERVQPERMRLENERIDSPSDRNSRALPSGDTPAEQNRLQKQLPQRGLGNCDNLRQSLEESDITQIKIDTSPAFVQGYKNAQRANTKEGFAESSPMRKWYDQQGRMIAEGRLVDMAYGSVILEGKDKSRIPYLMNRLSDADQVYACESWGVPVTCSLGDGSFDPRNFVAATVTWKAANACHKPLYFEEPQLERYGHEWGPWAQPAISSLNFFKNVAILPYKMGIHPMNECQYPLGYYRPGSCAPWTVGPIPLSLRGAATQAAFVTGAAAVIP